MPIINQFQPSEAAKIFIIVALAAWFARWQTEVRTFWRGFIMPGIIAGIPIVLIACETDMGTALSLSVAVGAEYREVTAANKSDSASQIQGEVLGSGSPTPDRSGTFFYVTNA